MREIVKAIPDVDRTGIAWEYLRHDFPARTEFGYDARWEADDHAANP